MAEPPPDGETISPRTQLYTPDTDATLPPADFGDAPADAPPSHAGRIELTGEIARGGMGAVLRGRDPALNRSVAVKVLLGSLASRPDVARRFVEEAQITGQLQHPGVVPVYDIGQFADGRPFFAMKLVEGRTLADLLAERPNPVHDLPRFLTIFEQIAQAVAFAHSRHTLHRDLKPQNVMVGAFGEVQVMDWGLAKVLGAESKVLSDHADSELHTQRSALAAIYIPLTQAGATLGTLAYMPPEQARGEADRLDERADVFGLGAVLCEILTGQPPYVGSGEQLWWQAVNADVSPAHARLDGSGADADLIALAKVCLSAEPADRPRDAGKVAAAITAHLAGVQERLRATELERTAAEARAAAERKGRRTQLALAVSVMVTVLATSITGLWLQRQRAERAAEAARQRADAEQRVAVAVQKAKSLDGQPAAALAAAEQARGLAADDRISNEIRQETAALADALRTAADQAERDRVIVEALRDASDIAENSRAPFAGDEWTQREYLVYYYDFAFRAWGADLARLSDADATTRMRARPPLVRRELAAGLDQWAWHARLQQRPATLWQRLLQLAAAVDPDSDPIRTELRALASRNRLGLESRAGAISAAFLPWSFAADIIPGPDRRWLRELAERADVAAVPIQSLTLLAAELHAARDAERAVALLRAAVRARPGDVLLYERLAHALFGQAPPRWTEAIAQLQTARALRPRLAARLAMSLVEIGRPEEALAVCQAAEALRPDPATPYLRAAQVEVNRDRMAPALPFLQAAARLGPIDRWTRYQLGVAYEQSGDFAAAIVELQTAADSTPATVQGPQMEHLDRQTRARFDELDRQFRTLSQQALIRCQHLATLALRLPAVMAGSDLVTPSARCELALVCQYRGRCRDSVRLYAEAFAAEPQLGERLQSHRYNAACAAARAGTGRSADEADAAERARLRWQALDWLRADLAAASGRLNDGGPAGRAEVRRLMLHWQADIDLTGVRGEPALAALPPEEREAFRALWAEVVGLARRAESGANR